MGVRRGSRWRPSLLLMTAGSALAAVVGNAVGLSAQPLEPLPIQSRLGAAIADDANIRDRAAARRGRTLDLREQAVRAAEARLKSDTAAKPDEAAQAAAAGGPPPPSQYDDLAKIYAAMKPAAAAAVMEQLDLEVQMRVAQKMRERSIASVMAAMSPRGAAALTMALARKQAGAGAAAAGVRPRPGTPTPAPGAAATPRDRRPS